jgi:hypothetical protein
LNDTICLFFYSSSFFFTFVLFSFFLYSFLFSFSLDESDFPTLLAYNDYLETSADILYSLTYGSKNDQLLGRKRMEEYLRNNRTTIEASKMKKIQLKGEQERAERNATLSSTASTPQPLAFNIPSFQLPEPAETSLLSSYAIEEKRIAALPSGQAKNQAMWLLEENKRLGGGFKRDEERSRSKKEALEGLWMN